ncbi:hypothetical protein [Haladaptatus cibarius]|uniref:hypothetical protein n=1 Tax=Haladaptatus cibarius TaxID=453847 RepID=UPI0006793B8F|nr:hypothetical protein [Haladaptatus cibarius]
MPNRHENQSDTNSWLEIADTLLTGALLGAGAMLTARLTASPEPSKSAVFPRQVGEFTLFRGDFYHLAWTDYGTTTWHVRRDSDEWIVHRRDCDVPDPEGEIPKHDSVSEWQTDDVHGRYATKHAAVESAITGMVRESDHSRTAGTRRWH